MYDVQLLRDRTPWDRSSPAPHLKTAGEAVHPVLPVPDPRELSFTSRGAVLTYIAHPARPEICTFRWRRSP